MAKPTLTPTEPPIEGSPEGSGAGALVVTLLSWLITLAVIALIAYVANKLRARVVFFLGKDEQVLIEQLTDTEVVNGPGTKIVSPLVKSVTKRKAELLEPLDYILVKDSLNGTIRVEKGPQLHFLGAFDVVQRRATAHSLTPTQYCTILDKRTGERRIEKGPRVLVPGPYEDCSPPRSALSLESNHYCKILDKSDGRRWVVRGACLLFPEPTWEVQGGVQTAISLKKVEYCRLIDEVTGAIRVERGEQLVFPEATEAVLNGEGILTAVNLKVFQYAKIIDNATGVIRVVRGEDTVYLGANEDFVGRGKTDAVELDQETAVQVRSKRTGELMLVSAPAGKAGKAELFFPKAEENIVEVQSLYKLADYECMIIVNGSGELSFYYGDDTKRGDLPRAFFIPPHHSVHSLLWSKGRRREKRDLRIDRIDCRPMFMSFEFNCRTSDNVELVLEGTFFWQVVDVERMVLMTGDTTGDICNHARSKFIQLVSKVTLKEFMDDFNNLATQAHESDDEFYARRGVAIHTLEVTAYRCQDASTARILEQIIQETTNRMNRLSQQESENEIKMFAMTGEIEQETRRANLLKVLQSHKLLEAQNEGEAEAERVRAFLSATEKSVPKLENRIALWQTLRKRDALEAVASGDSRLYFTPNDVNLTIESKEA